MALRKTSTVEIYQIVVANRWWSVKLIDEKIVSAGSLHKPHNPASQYSKSTLALFTQAADDARKLFMARDESNRNAIAKRMPA